MQSNHKQQLFAYLLSIMVLFTLGMDFNVGTDDNSHKASKPSSLPFTSIYTESTPTYVPLMRYAEEAQVLEPIQSHGKQHDKKLLNDRQMIVEKSNIEQPEVIEISMSYEVTSHFLNVRTKSSVSSEIINVVKYGDVLEVQEVMSNSWLKLKIGGYVHSKYTKLLNDSDRHAIKHKGQLTIHHTRTIEPSNPTSTVNSDSSLNEADISEIFEGTLLADHGLENTILEIEEEYGINAYFTIAVMKLESGHGKSKIAKEKNNLFGLNAIDGDAFNKAFSFKTKGESIRKFGQLISDHYIDEGYTSVEKVASKYCQANPKWSALVMKIMKNDYKKLQ